jgi:hypothetical protein
MVYVGSDYYYPFMYLAKIANIPWYICSDGEDEPHRKLVKALKKLGENPDIKKHPNIVCYPDKQNYEKYIVCPKYREAIESAIISVLKKNEAHEKALKKEWSKKTNVEIITELENNKTKYAKPVAESIVSIQDREICIPQKIIEIFDVISKDQNIRRCDEV